MQNIQVTLKGEVFYISDISTVKDLQSRLEDESGLTPEQQGCISFQGKVLESTDSLVDVGVINGNQINVIPQKMADHWKMMNNIGNGLVTLQEKILHHHDESVETRRSELIQDFQVMVGLYEDLTTKMPYMQEEMERFCQLLKNPKIADHATDPDRVESLRRIMLNNPLLLSMLQETSPSTVVALQDPKLWLQHVTRAVEEWKTMESYQLWKRLMEGRLL